MTRTPPAEPGHAAYHAHVYFDRDTVDTARRVTDQLGELFDVRLGRVHERPVGPHPKWSRQVAFTADVYRPLIDWLDAHRQGLTVLVHADTGDDLADHTEHAFWLGEADTLKLDMFRDPPTD